MSPRLGDDCPSFASTGHGPDRTRAWIGAPDPPYHARLWTPTPCTRRASTYHQLAHARRYAHGAARRGLQRVSCSAPVTYPHRATTIRPPAGLGPRCRSTIDQLALD